MNNSFRRKRRQQQGSIVNRGQNSGVQIAKNDGSVTVNQQMLRGGRSDAALLHDYLCRLHDACNVLVSNVLSDGKAGQSMEMARVFTMLRVQQYGDMERLGTSLLSRRSRDVNESPTVIEALAQQHACVLLGEPGGGKSTVVEFLALALAEAQLDLTEEFQGGGLARLGDAWTTESLLPVRVRLKEAKADLWEGVPEVLHNDVSDDERVALIALLEQRLRDGALLLLDGLDEVPTKQLESFQRIITDARIRFKKSRIIVSCRVFDYQNEPKRQLAGLTQLVLQRFDEDAQRAFVTRWYDELVRTERHSHAEGQSKCNNLLAVLRDRPELSDLAGTPLLLVLIALVHTEDGELPSARAALYYRCVHLLLVRWRPPEVTEAALDEGLLLTLATELGYHAHAEEQRQGGTFRGLTRNAIREVAEAFFRRAAGQGIEAQRRAEQQGLAAAHRLRDSNGLLLAVGDGRYAFAHRTFQEYLAGQYLGVDTRSEQVLEHAGDDHWRVALHLMAGYGAREGNRIDYVLGLINELLHRDDDSMFLAAEMLAEIGAEPLRDKGRARVFRPGGTGHSVVEKLRAIAFTPAQHPDPRSRNRAATLLDRLGADQRPALDWHNKAYWATPIPAGPFVLGKGKDSFVYTITQSFALAQFPVTNQQYFTFLEDLGHDEAERRRPLSWPGRSFRAGKGSHPVVGVDWYDATAFAAWVDEKMRVAGMLQPGETVRLPIEPEWERAAAYPVQVPPSNPSAGRRAYPWGYLTKTIAGSTLTSIPANIAEINISGTSVVGIFPHGAAACNAQDMSGNVWEWCSTPYLTYKKIRQAKQVEPESLDIIEDKIRRRRTYVLRGGSWSDYQQFARCAFRYDATPDDYADSCGFRLARCSPRPWCLFDFMSFCPYVF